VTFPPLVPFLSLISIHGEIFFGDISFMLLIVGEALTL